MIPTRNRAFQTFKEAQNAGPYDELPMLPAGIDPQVHMSRNDRMQPFWLILQKDSIIVQMTGAARVDMRDGPVLWEELIPGDFLYIPGGTPHRITPKESSVMHRFKAECAGLEAVAWYCERCTAPLWRRVWDTARVSPQAGFLHSCQAFNTDVRYRTCSACSSIHPLIDLDGYRWAEIGESLR